MSITLLTVLFTVSVGFSSSPLPNALQDSTNSPNTKGADSVKPGVTRNSALPPPAINTPVSNTIVDIRVTDAYKLEHADIKDKERNLAGIGDIIVIKVKNLQALINKAKCLDKDGKLIQGCTEQEISLFLDGRKITGIVPESGAPRPEDEKLQYHIQRNTDNDEAWADLLGAPRIGSKFFKRPTEVSVGLENGYPEKTEVKIRTLKEFKIVRIREHRFWWYSVGLLVLLLLIIWLARKSDILRDIGLSPNGNKLKPYSLARCQMAFWFFWVIGSFLYIWLITGAYDIINGSVLALIGIGAGTALGAAAIDIGKQNEAAANQGKVDTLIAELQTVDSRITLLNNQISTSPPNLNSLQLSLLAEQARRDYIKNQITSLINVTLPQASQGFLNDILTDSTGVSFHRFQMATWTVVLGVLFIYSVWNRLSMPEFSATLLGLLGISSGTYLGFKIPEKQN